MVSCGGVCADGGEPGLPACRARLEGGVGTLEQPPTGLVPTREAGACPKRFTLNCMRASSRMTPCKCLLERCWKLQQVSTDPLYPLLHLHYNGLICLLRAADATGREASRGCCAARGSPRGRQPGRGARGAGRYSHCAHCPGRWRWLRVPTQPAPCLPERPHSGAATCSIFALQLITKLFSMPALWVKMNRML